MTPEQIAAVDHAVANVLGFAFAFFVAWLIYQLFKEDKT